MASYTFSPKEECQFVHNVKGDLDTYQQKRSRRSVLLFPPLPSRLRYLIHVTVEDQQKLHSFSVGPSWCRRLVVCHPELRGEQQENGDLDGSNSSSEMEGYAKPKASTPVRSRAPKRPDKALYTPRAARGRMLSSRDPPGPSGDQQCPGPALSSSPCISASRDSCSCLETTEKSPSLPSVTDCVPNHATADSPEPSAQTQPDTEPPGWDQTVTHFADMSLEENNDDDDDDDDDVESSKDLFEEIKAHLKEAVSVSIEHAHNDYSIYQNVNIDADEFRHVIEIYNFPAAFKTDDLLDAFTEYSDGGMKIKWIDNTHALGVFASESAALEALSICHPLLKTRELSKGSKKAKGKAIRQAEFIQPVKERPRTNCAVAQRMVTRALGLQGRGRVQRY